MTVETEGFEEFQRALEEFQRTLAAYADLAGEEAQPLFEQALMIVQGEAADYPAQPEGADYRRTGTLGRTWLSAGRVIEGTVWGRMVGKVDNATPYGPYVMDPKRQAWFHAGSWKTTREVVKEARPDIDALLEDTGVRIVRRLLEGVL